MRETSGEIEDAAASWAARIDREQLAPSEANAFDTWLAGDVRRAGAFARASAVLALVDNAQGYAQAIAADMESATPAARGPAVSRRALIAGGAGAAAAAAAGVAMVRGGPPSYQTGVGEVLLVPLPDGSVATLSTASKILVNFDNKERRIELVHGEALFEVTKNPTRPFIVSANGSDVRAVGTAFTVRRQDPVNLRVLVQEGVVELKSDPASEGLLMTAGMQADQRAGKPAHVREVESAEIDRQLAWRQGKIALRGETLAEAVQEFNRYNDIPIVLGDEATAQKTVTGMFAATNPEGFAEAVAVGVGLEIRVERDRIILSSKTEV
jgi:transmembrane sensor